MTLAQAISMVRVMLDEPRFEYHGSSTAANDVFIRALEDAAEFCARTYWYRGEKEALRPLETEELLVLAGDKSVTPSTPYLFVETVIGMPDDTSPTYYARYVPPEKFFSGERWNIGNAPSATRRYSGAFEYTTYGGKIYLNHPTSFVASIRVLYVAVPSIPLATPLGNQLPLAEYVHGAIVDKAAEILYRKEVPGGRRSDLGSLLDLSVLGGEG